MAANTTTNGGGTVTSFSNAPQASDDVFALTEDSATLVNYHDGKTIISLDVMADDGGGNAKSLYSIDDGTSLSTATKTYAPIDLTKVDTLVNGLSAWEPSGTDGIQIRINSLTGKVEMDLSVYLANHGWSSLQSMQAGQHIDESFTYAIKLANGTLSWATAEIHITGSNDAAIITGTSTVLLTETDAALVTGGTLSATDVDSDASFVAQTNVAGSNGYGTFSIGTNGQWTYAMNSAHNEFKGGVDYTDSFTVTTADGTSKVVTVTIHGTNDAPKLTGTQAMLGSGSEDQTYTVSKVDLLAGFSDAEGDTMSVSGLTASHGSLHDNGDGSWTFTPDSNFHGTVTLNYIVIDGNGGSIAATETFGVSNVDDEATGTLVVSGDAEEGGSLTASLNSVTDDDGGTTTSYQWQEKVGDDWVDIAGEDDATLSVPDDQSYVGKEVRVVATTTDSLGGQTEFVGDAQTIANVDDEATGTLGVTGTAAEGGSLSADTSDLADLDDGIQSIAYQWQLDGADIDGATAETLSIPTDQSYVGHDVRLVVTTTDNLGGTSSLTSDAQTIANVDDEATGTLGVTGEAEEGGSLTALLADAVDADGGPTTSYQWQEKIAGIWTDISGEDEATLGVPDDQSYVGKEVRVIATTTDPLGGQTEFIGNAQTVANVDDAATGALGLTGDAEEGGALTADTSGLSDVDDGIQSIAYQWQLDGADIDGATEATLNIPTDQSYVGHDVQLVVTTTDSFGGTSSFTSDAQTIANVEDEATGTLGLIGDAEEGGALTADTSSLSDADDGIVSISYQWQEKIADVWTDISGEQDVTLNIPEDQSYVGKEVRVVATTTDALGGETVFEGAGQTIANVNDAPEAAAGSSSTDEDVAITGAALPGYTDVDGDTATYALGSDATNGTVAVHEDGTFDYTPDENFHGTDSFSFVVSDAFGGSNEYSYEIAVASVNDAPTDITLSAATVAENAAGATIGTLAALGDPDDGATHSFTVDDTRFEVVGTTLKLKAAQSLNFEATSSVAVKVTADDGSGGTYSETFQITVTDVNEAPSVSLTNVVVSTPENGAAIKVADIVITDDALGTNGLSLGGTDAGSFSIVGSELRFNGGANFEVKASYDVTVNVNDAAVGGSPDGTAALTLTIADVVETVNASLPTTSVAADDPNNHDSDTGTATISGANATGGAGNDVLVGNNGANTIAGGAGNDTIYGGSGNDSSLAGDDGNDTIYGQGGNDTVNGGNQNDFIYGGSGGDTLNGNAGNDTIYGGSGNDTIDGGADSDTIVGGYGADAINPGSADGVADTIRYLSLLDTNDSISNFVSGIDKIDLSGIDASSSLAGDQNFAWGGQETGPYVEANSVTWYTTGGNVIVLADTDGNLNTAEFSITLTGITSISSSDFNTL